MKTVCVFKNDMNSLSPVICSNITKGKLQIDAHRSPLIAMAFSSNGTYIATASEHGTIIRVHLISDATKVNLEIIIYALFMHDCLPFLQNS